MKDNSVRYTVDFHSRGQTTWISRKLFSFGCWAIRYT